MQTVRSASFNRWVDDRELNSIGTNYGSRPVAFQGWQKFKEAFAPELISRATRECEREVRTVLDPFGGSGTTGLAAQFLGLDSVVVEVNPYLADLIEAKLTHYDTELLRCESQKLVSKLLDLATEEDLAQKLDSLGALPPTFIEPGVNERWLFSKELGGFLAAALAEIDDMPKPEHRRLFRVVVGGCLVPLSNVRVSGKGRRYRTRWSERENSAKHAAEQIASAILRVVDDIERFQPRESNTYRLIRGDARKALATVTDIDVAVFSPPYPNSFDYTDVYNVELWLLGYLASSAQNRELRSATLASHVQIRREFSSPPEGSPILEATLEMLNKKKDELWDREIPAMVGGYFADMAGIITEVRNALSHEGEVWMVVGDSRYSGIDVKVADILVELAPSLGYVTVLQEPFRSMRSSPQQGGTLDLAESLIVLRKVGNSE